MQKGEKLTRKEQALVTRNKIYASAEMLFKKYGYENVNVDDIVKSAKVAKGSFYVHFESKDALIATLINDYVKKADSDYKAFLESLPTDLLQDEVLLALIGKIADVIAQEIGCENMKNLYRILLLSNPPSNSAINFDRELYKILFAVISKGFEEGCFASSFTPEEIARQFVMSYRGVVYEWCVRYPEMDLKTQAMGHFKVMLEGIKAGRGQEG